MGPVTTQSAGSLGMHGSIFGGQQPVSGSSIKLYTVGKTGNGSAATPMLTTAVFSDSLGNFSIGGDFTCASANDPVYITATGGNPGLAQGTNNPALVMMTALGRCGDLSTSTYITINEVTTAVAAWTLAPFMTSATNVGASATNAAGIGNAFLNARLLVDIKTGGVAVLPSNVTVEGGKIYALANSLAGCVNSDGTAGCSALFAAATPSGGTAAADTLQAALNVVKNPGNHVADVFNAATATAPFAGASATAPNDWTLSMTVTGAGMSSPTAVSLDGSGNVWVGSFPGVLSAFSPQGTPLNSTGYGVGTLSEVYGVAVDANNDVWATVEEQPRHTPTRGSVVKFAGANATTPGSLLGIFYDATVNYPYAVAADTNGNVVAANYAGNSPTLFTTTGAIVNSGMGAGSTAFAVAVAFDLSHGIWVANQADNTVSHLAADGTLLARPACCNGANGIAVDALGNAWASNYYSSSVSEISSSGAVVLNMVPGGGLNYPAGVAIDGNQDVWVANYRGTSFTHLAGNGGSVTAGTPLSPKAGLGLDASLLLPVGIAVDGSGDLWLSSFGNSGLVEFFGLAAPTKTPALPGPVQP